MKLLLIVDKRCKKQKIQNRKRLFKTPAAYARNAQGSYRVLEENFNRYEEKVLVASCRFRRNNKLKTRAV